MKVLTVLMLFALPLLCYAGSGCRYMEDVIEHGIDGTQSPEEFIDYIQDFVINDDFANAVRGMKRCINRLSPDILRNLSVMRRSIITSYQCKDYV